MVIKKVDKAYKRLKKGIGKVGKSELVQDVKKTFVKGKKVLKRMQASQEYRESHIMPSKSMKKIM